MRREPHVRFCERVVVRSHRATHRNIHVRSQAAGERVMASMAAFLEGRLHLRVNQQKSAVAPVGERQFLGHRLGKGGSLGIAPKSLARAKDRLRRITQRNRGISLERMTAEVNAFTTGWVTYFRHAQSQYALRNLDGWLRRKLRCVRLKQCKRVKTIADFLQGNDVPEWRAWRLPLGKRMVADGRKPIGSRSHAHQVVRYTRTGQPRQPPCRVEPCRKPPWYVKYARWCEREEPRGTSLLDQAKMSQIR